MTTSIGQRTLDDAGRALLQRSKLGRTDFQDLVIVPIIAVVFALIFGAIVMLATGVDIATIGASFPVQIYGRHQQRSFSADFEQSLCPASGFHGTKRYAQGSHLRT